MGPVGSEQKIDRIVAEAEMVRTASQQAAGLAHHPGEAGPRLPGMLQRKPAPGVRQRFGEPGHLTGGLWFPAPQHSSGRLQVDQPQMGRKAAGQRPCGVHTGLEQRVSNDSAGRQERKSEGQIEPEVPEAVRQASEGRRLGHKALWVLERTETGLSQFDGAETSVRRLAQQVFQRRSPFQLPLPAVAHDAGNHARSTRGPSCADPARAWLPPSRGTITRTGYCKAPAT